MMFSNELSHTITIVPEVAVDTGFLSHDDRPKAVAATRAAISRCFFITSYN